MLIQLLKKLHLRHVHSIPTHMTKGELNTLFNLTMASHQPRSVLEIGSYLGASSCYIATALSLLGTGKLYCVDTWQNQTMPEGERDTFSEFSHNTKSIANHIIPIRKNSFELVKTDINCQLSLVFIDGDHSYCGVKHDFEKVSPWIIEGGTLAFHDCIHFEGVSRVIGEALATGNWQFIGHIDNLLWLRKIERVHFNFAKPILADRSNVLDFG